MNRSFVLQVRKYMMRWPLMLTTLKNRFIDTLREQELVPFLVVFCAYLASARLGQYIFFNFDTSPALIWAPPGIALAALLLGGYRMWLPVFAAQLCAGLVVGLAPVVLVVATITSTLQPIVGTWILRKFNFDTALSRTRDALLMIGVALVLPALSPALTTLTSVLTDTLATSAWINFSRAWAGGVLSMLVLTPFIITWLSQRPLILTRRNIIENVAALTVLSAAVYIVFWTTLPQVNVFVVLYLLFTVLFWIGLRLGPRILSFSLFLVTAFGMAGSIIAHPTTAPINQQLFADELFMILIGPIFLILSALVEERRITGRKLSDSIAELKGALEKLGREDESKNEFIATLAHELRNPLAPIVSTLEYLKLEEQQPETRKLIQSAEEQTQIMRRLLDDLLDVARVTQKRFRLQEETLSLQSAVVRSLQTVDLFVKSQQQTLEVSLPENPLWVYGDPVRLTQICTNILYNASKYTHRGGRISLVMQQDGGEAVVSVADNGVGIEAERITHIFEPFVHKGPRRTVGTGLGIGLSLTKRLVEMHHGSIEAHSEGANKGSIFTVRLPIAPEPQTLEFKAPATSRHNLSERFSILVVDDNEAAAHSIEKLLTRKGHSVTLVYDGIEAINTATSSHPDVVLLDIGLPDIDGYEVARRLRELVPSPYLVALTGYGQEDDKSRAVSAGFNFHLTKPVALADIEGVLAAMKP